jgi:N-acetylglutamate synthase-like GNAT family acetyltransferase
MATSELRAISELEARDIGACLKLSDEAGWNQNAEDWRLFIEEGRAFGVRDADGRLVASAAALPYERDIAYLSMVLVTRSQRRQGIATRLVDLCVEHIGRLGLVPVLDATPAGEAVYSQQGFRVLFGLERWQGEAEAAGTPSAAGVRPAMPGDAEMIAALDAGATGASRGAVIADFAGRADSHAFLRDDRSGFVLVRRGRRAFQLGPLVAGTPAGALKLLGAALGAVSGAVFIDVPVLQKGIGDWLAARGFIRQRGFSRMAFGRSEPFGATDRLFASAGPEFG